MAMVKKIKAKIKELISISFVRDTSILQIGRFIYIGLGAVNSILLARFLKPELYGMYGLIFAFVALVGLLMNWGGSYASLTLLSEACARKDKKEILNILTYYAKLTIYSTVLVGLVCLILAPWLTEIIYHRSDIGNWSRLVLLSSFIAIFYNLLVIILQTIRHIKQLTFIESLNKLIYSFFPIVLIFVGWGLGGLVWGYFFSSLIFLIISIYYYRNLIKKETLLPSFKEIYFNFNKIKIKKYFRFGFSIAVDKNLGTLISLIPLFFLGFFALPQEVGYFKIAFAYITIPSMLLEPVSRLLTVQLPKSKVYGIKIFKNHFFKTSFYSGLITFFLISPFLILAPFLVKFFYGPEYQPAIKLIYYLAVFAALSGFGVGLGPFYRTMNKMRISILVNIGQVITITLLILSLIRIYHPLIAVIWSIIIGTTLFLILHFAIIKSMFKK